MRASRYEKAVTKEEAGANGPRQLLSSPLLSLTWQTGLRVCGYTLCLSRSFLLKTEMPSQAWRAALQILLLRILNGSTTEWS